MFWGWSHVHSDCRVSCHVDTRYISEEFLKFGIRPNFFVSNWLHALFNSVSMQILSDIIYFSLSTNANFLIHAFIDFTCRLETKSCMQFWASNRQLKLCFLWPKKIIRDKFFDQFYFLHNVLDQTLDFAATFYLLFKSVYLQIWKELRILDWFLVWWLALVRALLWLPEWIFSNLLISHLLQQKILEEFIFTDLGLSILRCLANNIPKHCHTRIKNNSDLLINNFPITWPQHCLTPFQLFEC